MNLLGKGSGSTVDTRVMDTAQHKHLIVGFIAKAASLANFVHKLKYVLFYMNGSNKV